MKLAFNLLPWREELSHEAKQAFIRQGALAAVLGLVICGTIYFSVNLLISSQESKNTRIQTAIKTADEKIKEIKDLQTQINILVERKKVVESLQNNRNQATRIMEQMGVRLPDGVFLSSIKQNGPKITIIGIALNQALVASTMTQLDNSEWFASPLLVEIKAVDTKADNGMSVKASNFTLSVRYTNPEDVVLPGLIISPDQQLADHAKIKKERDAK